MQRKQNLTTWLVGMKKAQLLGKRVWQFLKQFIIELLSGTSLMVQWLRIHLPMQGTQVRSLVWEDPTTRRAIKPSCHNY